MRHIIRSRGWRARCHCARLDSWQKQPSNRSLFSADGRALHRIRDSRDDAPGHAAWRRQPVAGLSRFSGPGGDQTRGAGSDCRRRQSVRHHLGSEEPAQCHRPADAGVAGHRGRSRTRNHGLLRLDRDHDLDSAGSVQRRRRGRHLRAVLRKLRAGRDSLRRQAAIREAAPAGYVRMANGHSTSTNCGRRFTITPRPSS